MGWAGAVYIVIVLDCFCVHHPFSVTTSFPDPPLSQDPVPISFGNVFMCFCSQSLQCNNILSHTVIVTRSLPISCGVVFIGCFTLALQCHCILSNPIPRCAGEGCCDNDGIGKDAVTLMGWCEEPQPEEPFPIITIFFVINIWLLFNIFCAFPWTLIIKISVVLF